MEWKKKIVEIILGMAVVGMLGWIGTKVSGIYESALKLPEIERRQQIKDSLQQEMNVELNTKIYVLRMYIINDSIKNAVLKELGK